MPSIESIIQRNHDLVLAQLKHPEIKILHDELATELTEKTGLQFDTLYRRDLFLREHYGFYSFPWIIKHKEPLSNPDMLKFSSYQISHLAIYENPLSTEQQAPLTRYNYKTDPMFCKLVSHFKKNNELVFAGITEGKGGLLTLASIITEQEASLRFMGALGNEELPKSTCAYAHGPFFMMTSREQLSQFNRTHNDIYDIPLSHLTFLVPTELYRDRLRSYLTLASEKEFITPGRVEAVLSTVFTYAEYHQALTVSASSLNFFQPPATHYSPTQTFTPHDPC